MDFLFGVVCPAVGTLIGNVMFTVPLPAVTKARHHVDMGALNPLPWVAAFINCLGFSIYGILRQDQFVFLANAPGLVLSVFYTFSAVSVLSVTGTSKNMRIVNLVQGLFMFGVLFWTLLGFFCGWMFSGDNGREQSAAVIGTFSAIFCVIYYAAPMSSAMEVIVRKDASSLHAPMVSVNALNSSLWFVYGFFAIDQPQIWVPNIVGASLALVQLLLIACYGRGTGTRPSPSFYQPIIDNEQTPTATPLPYAPRLSTPTELNRSHVHAWTCGD